jgi:glycosyltransferase involved in cell wall biosynthesis
MMHKIDDNIPLISVGMPVYNGEKTLKAALDSVLSQTIGDFELIISDNASTDNTEEICRKYAADDSRISYIRQLENIGAPKNFKFVLDEAQAKYFMWATSDDIKSIDFLEKNYYFLENNPDYVASTSPARFEGGDFNSLSMGDASLIGNLPDRIQNFFVCWHANARYCSLMRTDVIKLSPYVGEDFFGSDWAAMLYVIYCGKTNRHNQGFVVLGRNGFSNSENILKYYRKRWLHWFLPFLELSKLTLSLSDEFQLQYKIKIIGSLVKLNLQAVRISIRKEIGHYLGL